MARVGQQRHKKIIIINLHLYGTVPHFHVTCFSAFNGSAITSGF
jgi:hypothetical protein